MIELIPGCMIISTDDKFRGRRLVVTKVNKETNTVTAISERKFLAETIINKDLSVTVIKRPWEKVVEYELPISSIVIVGIHNLDNTREYRLKHQDEYKERDED